MAANDPVVDEIIADCKLNMQLFCDTYNHLFEIGTSYVKIDDEVNDDDKLFFLGEHILLGCKRSRNYLIAAGSKQSNITSPNIVTIEKGKFSITTYDSSNAHYSSDTIIVDGPLMIAVKINDKYHFVGLAVVGAENKIGVFSIIKSLSNDDLKTELLDAVKESSHILCFEDRNSFFNDGKFKPGININERGHAAAEIRRLKKEMSELKEKFTHLEWIEEIRRSEKPGASKKHQIKALEKINAIKEAAIKTQEKITAINEALKENSPEKLHILLEKNSSSFCNFFTKKKKPKLCENLVYRSLSKEI